MPADLKKAKITIDSLPNMKDEDKADLISLITDLEIKETEITSLRAKAPKDSQRVVESVEWDKMQSALKERDDLESKLKQFMAGQSEGPLLAALAPCFEIFDGN